MEENQIVSAEDVAFDFGDGDNGFDGVSSKCRKMAFLKIAQAGSPEMKDPAKRIPDLNAADYYCPQTGKIYGKRLRVVIGKFWTAFSVYEGEGPDSKFKGNISEAEFESRVRENSEFTRKGFIENGTGLRYVDTRNFLVLPYDSPEDGPMIYSMYSTAIAASKDWVTKFTNNRIKVNFQGESKIVQVPIYGQVWNLAEPTYVPDNGGYYRANPPTKDELVNPKYLGAAAKTLYIENKSVDATKLVETDPNEAADEHSSVQAARAAVASVFGGKPAAKKEAEPFFAADDDEIPLV